MNRQFQRAAVVLLTALPLAIGCEDGATSPRTPDAGTDQLPAFEAGPAAAADRMLFQVRLGPLGGTTSHGIVHLEIAGGYLTVSTLGEGLEPLQHIPQHIHKNPTCDPGGDILINLDESLTVAGESAPVGAAFPVSNGGGVLNYHASRSLDDLLQAVNTYLGANLPSVEALVSWLDLDNRNVHMHVPFGPPFPAVNCGAVEQLK